MVTTQKSTSKAQKAEVEANAAETAASQENTQSWYTIYAKLLTGGNCSLVVHDKMSVLQVKALISQVVKARCLPQRSFLLVFAGNEMRDQDLLSEHGLGPLATVHAMPEPQDVASEAQDTPAAAEAQDPPAEAEVEYNEC